MTRLYGPTGLLFCERGPRDLFVWLGPLGFGLVWPPSWRWLRPMWCGDWRKVPGW